MKLSFSSFFGGRQRVPVRTDAATHGARQKAVAIPRDDGTGDPRRNVYADPGVYRAISDVTAMAHGNAQRLHEEAINRLYPGAYATSGTAKEVVAITQAEYDHMDLEAARKLEKDLLRAGFPLPGKTWTYRAVAKTDKALDKLARKVNDSAAPHGLKRLAAKHLPQLGSAVRDLRDKPLNYPGVEHMRDRRTYLDALRRMDKYDTAAQKLTTLQRTRRLGLERQLVYYQRMYEQVNDYLQNGAIKLSKLYLFDPERRELQMLATSVGALDAFFTEHFDVKPDARASAAAAAQLEKARADPARSQQVLRQYLRSLLQKVPLGLGDGSGLAPGNGLQGLAETYAMEAGLQQRRDLRGQILQIDKSVWLAPNDDPDAAPGSFKLVQPFGQDDGALTSKQLVVTRDPQSGGRHFNVELKTFSYYVETENADGVIERRYVPATGFDDPHAVIREEVSSSVTLPHGREGMEVLRQHFSISNLELLFDDGGGLGSEDFKTVHARVEARRALAAKVNDVVCKYVDEARDRFLAQTNVISAQETGYLFNAGMYGENLCVKSRERVMDRFSMKVPLVGSCGSHQRVAADHGRPVIALEHLPPYLKFLLNRHGSDPYTLGEPGKQTIGAYRENTLAAGVMETPLDYVPYTAAPRAAEPGRPVAQSKEHPLMTRDADDARYRPLNQRNYIDPAAASQRVTERRIWRPRDAANLSLHVRMSPDDLYGQPFNFHQPLPAVPRLAHPAPEELKAAGPGTAQGVRRASSRQIPVQVSENLRLRAIVMRDGSRRPVSETMLTLDMLRELHALEGFSHLEMTHEIPEGWALCDDLGQPVRDDEGNEVRLLERLIIRPHLVPVTRKELVHEQDAEGRLSPVYEDERQVRVFPAGRAPSGEPVFEDAHGGQASGRVRLKYVEVEEKESDLRFEITGIERWKRIPMPDAPGSQVAATKKGDGKPDRVLCTYRKETVDHTDPRFHQALYGLRDKLYFEMNCIHSQNPASDGVQEMAGPEEVAVSVVPNDARMPRPFMTAWSRQNPRTHAIHVDWLAPIQSLILEGMEGSNRGRNGFLVTLHTHQGHRDMGTGDMGVRLHPDHLTDYSGKIRKEYLAQLQGNLEGIFGAETHGRVGGIVREIESAAAESLPARLVTDRIDEEKLSSAQQIMQELEPAWRAYATARGKADAETVIAGLSHSGQPQLQAVAYALARNMNGWASEGETTGVLPSLARNISGLMEMLEEAMQSDPRSPGQLQRATQLRMAAARLQEMDEQRNTLQRVLDGEPAGENCFTLVRQLREKLDEVRRMLAGDEQLDAGNALVLLQASVSALSGWEREPEMLRRELQGALENQRKRLAAGEQVTVSNELMLLPEYLPAIRDRELIQNGRRRPGISEIRSRNDRLANRFLADPSASGDGRFTPLFRLFLEQDYLPPDLQSGESGADYRERRQLYWQDKDAIAASLRQRVAEIEATLPALRHDAVLHKQRIGELEREKDELTLAVSAWAQFRTRAAADFETADDAGRAAWISARRGRLADVDGALQAINEEILRASGAGASDESDTTDSAGSLLTERARLLEERMTLRREMRQARRIELTEQGRDWLAEPARGAEAIAAAGQEVDRLRDELARIGIRIARDEALLEASRRNEADPEAILRRMQELDNGDRYAGMGLDELKGEREILAAELDDAREVFDNVARIADGHEPVATPRSLARMGHVVRTDGATPAEIGEAAPPDEPDSGISDEDDLKWTQQVQSLALALAGPDGPEKTRAIDEFVAFSASKGMLDVLFPVDIPGPADKIEAAVRLLSAPEFAQSMRDMAPAEAAGIFPHALFASLASVRSQLEAAQAPDEDPESRARLKINYPDRSRRTQLANGLYASMASNAAIVATFAQVKEAIALAGVEAAKGASVAAAEASTALAADAGFGLVQIAAGVNLMKDARYTLRHLSGEDTGTRAVVEGAIRQYEQLADELQDLLRELQTEVDKVPGNAGPEKKRKTLDRLSGMLDSHLHGYHARLQLIRRDILDARVNAASGGLLSAAMTSVLGSATAKAVSVAAKSEVAATAADASGTMALAAGALYTTLGLTQAGLSARRLLSLRKLSEDLAFDLGYGVDSGERRAGNLRKNELFDMARRQLKAWGFFTAGGVLVTIGGAANAGGFAPFAGTPLTLIGSLMITGAVVHLYKLPLDLRGKDARAAFGTGHVDDGFLNSNRRLNQLGSCNRDKAAIQQETMWKFGRDVFDEKEDKDMRQTYRSAWLVPGAQRAALTRIITPSLDKPASIQVQFDFMQRTNVAELDWRYVEVEERTKDRDLAAEALVAQTEVLRDLRQRRDELQGTEAGQTGAGAAESLAELDRSIALAATFVSNLEQRLGIMERKLASARRVRAAALGLQNQLQAFSPELDRIPRDSVKVQLQNLRLRWMVVNNVLVPALGESNVRKMFQAYLKGKNTQNGARLSAVFDGVTYTAGSAAAIPPKARLERAEIDGSESTCEWIMNWIRENLGPRHVDELFVRAMVDCLPEACATESAILGDIHLERMKSLLRRREEEAGSPSDGRLSAIRDRAARASSALIDSLRRGQRDGAKRREVPSMQGALGQMA